MPRRSMSDQEGLFSRLHLRVVCQAEFGQTVHVSGSSFLVGRNDPSMSLEMVTTPEEYPVWRTSKPIIVARNQPHKYQYSLFEGGKFKKWEPLRKPRTVQCDTPIKQVDDVFGMPASPSDPSRLTMLQRPGALGRVATEDGFAAAEGGESVHAGTSEASLPARAEPPAGARLYLVCFHLPITLTREKGFFGRGKWQAVWNNSIIAKTDNSIGRHVDTHWVGTVSSGENREFTAEEKADITALLKTMECTPLFVPPDLVRGSYLGYCKQILWPAFHNVDVLDLASCHLGLGPTTADPTVTWDQANTLQWFDAYNTLNETFAKHMFQVLHEGDTMWVHDYHLMLLPRMLSDLEKERFGERRTSTIFFLHIPFPTSQIFRALAQGELLLRGMLSANVVGFHAFDHARHFLNAGKRLLGLSYQSIKGGLIGVEYDRRTVMVVMSHVGVEPMLLNVAAGKEEVETETAALKEKHEGRNIVSGIDVLQKLSGVTLKLLAFERLLADYPSWRERVVLVQWCLRPETRLDDEAQTAAEVNQVCERIRQTYGEKVLDYKEIGAAAPALEMTDRIALYRASDVFTVTAVREGLNLLPLEYIYARKDPWAPGVVLASEFSACTSLLNGAIRINPFDVQRVAAALDQALTMDLTERTGRRARDMPYISSRPAAEWTYQVLCDMWAMSRERSVMHIEDTTQLESDLSHEMSMVGFSPLDTQQVVSAYRQCSRRVLLFDYGGTLLEKEGLGKYLKQTMTSVSGRKLRETTHDAIKALCADERNTVFIISGLHDRGLLDALKDMPRLGLAAYNGLAFSWPSHDAETERTWEMFDYGIDWEEVNAIALPLFNKYTSHTNGSSIKLRNSGMAWSYYATDPEWGQMQAKQLTIELEAALAAYDVKVQHVRGQIEVVPRRLHKGVVAKAILRKQLEETGHYPDFVFCVGDDISDENMFTSVYSFLAGVDAISPDSADAHLREEADNIRLYMCTVGKKPTHATYYVGETSEVEDLVVALAAQDQDK